MRVENLFTVQTGTWSTHPVYCESVTFKNVVFHSGADGMDVDSCRHVIIDGWAFETSDDCISFKSGRGEEANTINRVCEDVHISNCTFDDKNFACIGIGSEISAGVRNVVIEHCKCTGARSHAITSRAGLGAARLREHYGERFEATGAKQGFLWLNNLNSGKQDAFPVPGDAGIPLFREFHLSNIHVTDLPMLVQATETDPRKPLVGFSLINVTGNWERGIALANMKNVVVRKVKVTGSTAADHISKRDWPGTRGCREIDPAKMPKVPDAVPAPEKPYEFK